MSLAPQASSFQPTSSTAALTVHMTLGGVERTLLSVVSTFGTALDVTAAELTIETFYDVTEQPISR